MHQMSLILFSVYLDQLYHRAKLIGDLVSVEIAKDSFVSKQVKPKYNKQHSVKSQSRSGRSNFPCINLCLILSSAGVPIWSREVQTIGNI